MYSKPKYLPYCKPTLILAFAILIEVPRLFAGEVPAAKQAKPPAAPPDKTARSETTTQASIDQPLILIAADSDEGTAKLLIRGLDVPPLASELTTGLLTSSQQPHLLLRPSLELVSATRLGQSKDFVAEIKLHDLIAFGDTTVPLMHNGKQLTVLKFSKPGLLVKPGGERGFVARENSDLILVLENPSSFEYKSVRARLRIDDQDICIFNAESFRVPNQNPQKRTSIVSKTCDSLESWTNFDIPKYAQVTLRATPHSQWFIDQDSQVARSAKRKGSLTLRFQRQTNNPIFEQNLPLDIQMEPSSWSLFWGILQIGLFLIVGALLSLGLRVSLPNIKRRRQLKEQLNEAARLTSSISNEVDSNLRVLLRVERLVLDELRLTVGPFGPSYVDYARRVEQGLPGLKRRIDAVRRLDVALLNKKLLLEHGPAPTRLEQIATLLVSVSETLKQDQLSDADWVFVSQRLETAEKMLREPTQLEKDAFEAALAARWCTIRDHFKTNSATSALIVPPALAGMEMCFPDPSLLPDANDDGSKWVKSIGPVRADLQLSALGMLWEFQFLSPHMEPGSKWYIAKSTLTDLLATPAIDNLEEAKSVLRQLAEGVSEADILKALSEGDAMILMDPALPRPNQKIRFSVCFRESQLNNAAARGLVTCHWSFRDHYKRWHRPRLFKVSPDSVPPASRGKPDSESTHLEEAGWYVHHYFEGDTESSEISVTFYDSKGKPVNLNIEKSTDAPNHWSRMVQQLRPSRRSNQKRAGSLVESFELIAALIVPLAALTSTTFAGNSAAHWWELVAIGFGSDTIKSILVARPGQTGNP